MRKQEKYTNDSIIYIKNLYTTYLNVKEKYEKLVKEQRYLTEDIFTNVDPDENGNYKIYRKTSEDILYMELGRCDNGRVWYSNWSLLKPYYYNKIDTRDYKLIELLITDDEYRLGNLFYENSILIRNHSYHSISCMLQKYINDKLNDLYKDVEPYKIPKILIVDICSDEYYVLSDFNEYYVTTFKLMNKIDKKIIKIK